MADTVIDGAVFLRASAFCWPPRLAPPADRSPIQAASQPNAFSVLPLTVSVQINSFLPKSFGTDTVNRLRLSASRRRSAAAVRAAGLDVVRRTDRNRQVLRPVPVQIAEVHDKTAVGALRPALEDRLHVLAGIEFEIVRDLGLRRGGNGDPERHEYSGKHHELSRLECHANLPIENPVEKMSS
jgi:hypothetical protein